MSSKRRIEPLNDSEVLDNDTGEILSSDDDPSYHEIGAGWYKSFDEGLDSLSQIGNASIKVLVYLIQNMNPGNVVTRTQGKMSKEVGLSVKYISKRMNELEDVGLVYVGRNYYMVNPDMFFKGNNAKRLKAQHNYYKRVRKKKYE